MNGEKITKALVKLHMNHAQLEPLLGYKRQGGRMVRFIENNERQLMPAQARLLEAYMAGYRPKDWPV